MALEERKSSEHDQAEMGISVIKLGHLESRGCAVVNMARMRENKDARERRGLRMPSALVTASPP